MIAACSPRQHEQTFMQAALAEDLARRTLEHPHIRVFLESTPGRIVEGEILAARESAGGVTVRFRNGDGAEEERSFDMLVVAPAMRPADGTAELAEMLRVGLSEGGFFAEQHPKLAPVLTSIEGVYLAGCAQGPKGIEDTLAQATAAGHVLASLVTGRRLETEARVCRIEPSLCRGCRTCLAVCAYSAIDYDETSRVCVANEVLCRGCGNCTAACPSGAARLRHFTPLEIAREVAGALQ